MNPTFSLPKGAELVRPLDAGGTFEAAIARRGGVLLVAKRPLRGLDAAVGLRALEREWAVLSAARLEVLPRAVLRGADEVGPYLCESVAPGTTLRALATPEEPVEAALWGLVARTTSRALSELHAARDERGALELVHGDLSPDNVLFDGARATLVDFAAARFRDAREPVFPSGRGTSPYAAPEIARGEASATAETDTYALAAVLAWLLVRRLTEANGGAAMLAEVGDRGVRAEWLETRRDVPEGAARALAEALRFAPSERLGSSRALAERLAAAW